jgi:hypothetical protein
MSHDVNTSITQTQRCQYLFWYRLLMQEQPGPEQWTSTLKPGGRCF